MYSLVFLRLLNDKRVAEEIERYKWIESERLGRDIGKEKAALEWIKAYGCIWLKIHKPQEYGIFMADAANYSEDCECCGLNLGIKKA